MVEAMPEPPTRKEEQQFSVVDISCQSINIAVPVDVSVNSAVSQSQNDITDDGDREKPQKRTGRAGKKGKKQQEEKLQEL